jgi:hypothetical protein
MSRQNSDKKARLLKIAINFNRLPSIRLIGTRFALSFIQLGYLCSLCFFLMNGCLVTDEIKFDDEPNVPPVLIDSPGNKTPIGDIIYFDYSSDLTGTSIDDASDYAPPSIQFSLRVRDENVGQPLEARRNIFVQDVSGKFGPFGNNIVSVPIVYSREQVRDIDFTIETGFFSDDTLCYRVELAVTSAFRNSVPNASNWSLPENDNDIAKTRWYVVTKKDTICKGATKYP